mmetsp:Transcript_21042/g.67055  ORF Transcript_21042/g.67055 Transcript_21042/m.67055 type:complete len:223 (-) Transcript_21042:444-1112(-)
MLLTCSLRGVLGRCWIASYPSTARPALPMVLAFSQVENSSARSQSTRASSRATASLASLRSWPIGSHRGRLWERLSPSSLAAASRVDTPPERISTRPHLKPINNGPRSQMPTFRDFQNLSRTPIVWHMPSTPQDILRWPPRAPRALRHRLLLRSSQVLLAHFSEGRTPEDQVASQLTHLTHGPSSSRRVPFSCPIRLPSHSTADRSLNDRVARFQTAGTLIC